MASLIWSKAYHRTALGQIHSRRLGAEHEASQPTLICLHPAPSSGLYFTTAMPLLNQHRDVIAPDYPGYGGSDPVDSPPQIGDYAQAMIQALLESSESPVDLMGFHTGCLVANEIALSKPDLVRRLVLIDVPFFTGEQQDRFRTKMTQPLPLAPELECLAGPWQFNITSRLDDVPMERAFALFAEHLRAGTQDWYGFHAAFSYDCENRFARLTADTTILATRSGLLDATHAAAACASQAKLVDVMDVDRAVFEAGAQNIAVHINAALGL